MALIGKFIRLAVLLVVAAISMTSAGFAEKQHLEAVGTYVLGDRDTRDVAERRAVKDAIRVATQMAGVYVESYSKVHNLVLTKDEVTTIALSIIRVYDQDVSFIDNGTVCKATVYVVAETDNIENILAGTSGKDNGTRQRPQPKSLAEMGAAYGNEQAVPEAVDVSGYTGVVIDCLNARNRHVLVVNRPGLEATEVKAKDGRVLFGYRTPTQKFSFDYAHGLSSYHPDFVEQFAGTNPLWIHALYIENPKKRSEDSYLVIKSGSIVVSDEDGDLLEDLQEQTGLLSGDHPPIVILGT